jgi:ribosomal protein S27AE
MQAVLIQPRKPRRRDAAIGITGAGNNKSIVFLRLRRRSGRCGEGDNIATHGVGDPRHCGAMLASHPSFWPYPCKDAKSARLREKGMEAMGMRVSIPVFLHEAILGPSRAHDLSEVT